ncbi:MAG TPA: hypothetical protein VIJ53_03940, partial [Acidobacteriaceae bacterium]
MIAVSADEINALSKSIKGWQHGLAFATFLATAFAFLAIFEWSQKFKKAFSILSCAFWAATILCGSQINTKTSSLQSIYATQTEGAETGIANLKPTVDSVKRTVDQLSPLVDDHLKPTVDGLQETVKTLTPKVNHLDEQVKSMQPKVSVLVNNENRITHFRIEVSYPGLGQRMENRKLLSKDANYVRWDSPELGCQGFSVPLYASGLGQRSMGKDGHLTTIDYELVSPNQLIGKPVAILDSCHALKIRITDLIGEDGKAIRNSGVLRSIVSMDAQLVVNEHPLQEYRLETPQSYWEPRIADAGFIVFD